nr:hypothetical protein BDOA9_0122290 [Bradyrhizobium sp. DOA9]
MKEALMNPKVRLLASSVLAATLLTVSIPADAGVRDHRSNAGGTYSTNTSPPPSVNRPGQATTDKATSNGGVTVTSRPRPKQEVKVCIMGTGSYGCTSNKIAVTAAKVARGDPIR